jgi:hypothetical protein
MSALLALIPLKDWLYGGAIVLLIVLGLHYHHKVLAEGIAEQKAADAKATLVLTQETAKQTAELQTRATMAEQAYDKEHQSILSQPSLPPVRLCGNAHNSGSLLPKAGAVVQGNAGTGAAPGDLQPVPSGDSSVGDGQNPDLAGLLGILAQRADEVSAELREYQAR